MEKDMYSPEGMAEATEARVQEIISRIDDKNLVGAAISSIAKELNKETYNGIIPSTKQGLLAVGVDETVSSLLMSHVFGSTELVIGLHARKIVCALDMYDWEDSSAERKQDVKMVNVSAKDVKASLKTWIPKGYGRDFHDLMDSIGTLIAANTVGTWGKIMTVINQHIAQKDKAAAEEMMAKISQFYKAIRSSGRRRVARC